MTERNNNPFHSFCVAGTHSGVGKTTVSLGLMSALRHQDLKIQPFKCGPDYIDPGHHKQATGVDSRNLDTWMMGHDSVKVSYCHAAQDADVAVTEGVMGLFDGASSTSREGSTADVCASLDIPIVLVVDAKGMARSIAALVHGFTTLDPDIRIIGIIANNVSSERHTAILKESLEAAGLPPLLGSIPKNQDWKMDERHLGLVTASDNNSDWYKSLGNSIAKHIDLSQLLNASKCERPQPAALSEQYTKTNPVRLGIARDEAFLFYYEDNLDLLRNHGAELVPFSPLHDATLPDDLDGLYIGGGYPELYAETLASNKSMRKAIKSFADNKGHIYAECGGLMYLCETLKDQDGEIWDMCDIFPVKTEMEDRLRRLGYVEATTLQDGFPGMKNTKIRGHEFHWSHAMESSSMNCFSVRMTRDKTETKAGFIKDNVWASYLHLHFMSNPNAVKCWTDHISR